MKQSRRLVCKRIVNGTTQFEFCDPDECVDAEPLFYLRSGVGHPANFEPLERIEPHDKKAAYDFAVQVMVCLQGRFGRFQRMSVDQLAIQRARLFLDGATPDNFSSDDPLEFLNYMIEQTLDTTSKQYNLGSHLALCKISKHLKETGKEIPSQLRQWIAHCPDLPKPLRGYNPDQAAVQEDTDELEQRLVEICSQLGPVKETGLSPTRNPLSKALSISDAVSEVLEHFGYRAGYSSVRQKKKWKSHLQRLSQFLNGDG